MSPVVLGTAGHIDHGKTALVRALTGVDTDRLREEKERGITIELGFAELTTEGGPAFGVVDVPGHEAFVRTMVAGAAGMDVVLLTVAADEGVMPQTREHLAIVELLGVPEMVVALTKCDSVDDPEWIELVVADVAELLGPTRYRGAPVVRTSAVRGDGLTELVDAIRRTAERADRAALGDLARLPLDRVFTVQGTGTVVTGTLWSGSLRRGDRVRLLPGGARARIRALEAHGRAVTEVEAGARTAVALVGDGADRGALERGSTLVVSESWSETWMLTAWVDLLGGTDWSLEHNQRVRVHLGTAEVMARCALLEPEPLRPGSQGWVQLRLEAPLVARARDRMVLRSYSPVTTIGGGVVAEPLPPKRKALDPAERQALSAVLGDSLVDAVRGALALAGWSGVSLDELPIVTGRSVEAVQGGAQAMDAGGELTAGTRVFAASVASTAAQAVAGAVEAAHRAEPLRPTVSRAHARAALPSWAPPELADAVLERLIGQGRLEAHQGEVRLPDHRAVPTAEQEKALEALRTLYGSAGLGAPFVAELPVELAARSDLHALLTVLEGEGRLRSIADGLYVDSDALAAASDRIRQSLAGRTSLGPGDFREALPVTRKHLIPLLNYFDGTGVTVRNDAGRDVPTSP